MLQNMTSNKQLSSYNFFHTTTKSLHRNEIDFCSLLQIYVDNLALRASWVVQACFTSTELKAFRTFFSKTNGNAIFSWNL